MTVHAQLAADATGLYVSGRHAVAGGSAFLTTDPSTGDDIRELREATRDDVDSAVADCANAQREWRAYPPKRRGQILMAMAARIRAAADELVEIDVCDGGLPPKLAAADVESAADYFDFYGSLIRHFHGRTIDLGPDVSDHLVHEPFGVCGIILPFNFPIQLAARDFAPALAAGNGVVAKPANEAPLAAFALAELWSGLDAPAGLLNVVAGGAETGTALVTHPDVRHVTFTGSRATGVAVATAAASTLTPALLELGGKSPHLVFDDADIESAIRTILATSFRTAGQACSAGMRIHVQSGVLPQFTDMLGSAVRALRTGPADSDPDVGPVISSKQLHTIVGLIDQSVTGGARVLTGGGTVGADQLDAAHQHGHYVEPTVLLAPDSSNVSVREEIFGPVLTVTTFDSDDEALAQANDTEYGLVAGVWTRDVDRALRFARDLAAGQVFVNGYGVGGGVEIPFGGFRASGYGRAKGAEALAEYSQLKNVWIGVQPAR